jgi:hypothetical protein
MFAKDYEYLINDSRAAPSSSMNRALPEIEKDLGHTPFLENTSSSSATAGQRHYHLKT